MKNPTLADTVAAVVSLMILTGAVWIAIYGPETPIPVHFDAAGQADRYGSRYELAAVLAGLALLNLLVAWMTGRQAASVADPVRRKGLQRGQWLSVLIMGAVAVFVAWASLGPAAAFDMSWPTVTGHLNALKEAELVSTEREGQSIRYRLEISAVEEALAFLMALSGTGRTDEAAEQPC